MTTKEEFLMIAICWVWILGGLYGYKIFKEKERE
jgi:hypothetical protein